MRKHSPGERRQHLLAWLEVIVDREGWAANRGDAWHRCGVGGAADAAHGSVFNLIAGTKIFVQPGVNDLRLHFEDLRALVLDVIRGELLSGHLFYFCNRSCTRVKVLVWDGSGFGRKSRKRSSWSAVCTTICASSMSKLIGLSAPKTPSVLRRPPCPRYNLSARSPE
jgi:hypothetical protein